MESDHGILEEKLLNYHRENNLHGVISAEHLLANISLSDEDVENVNTCTTGQWKSKEWYRHKAGIITASKAKRVFNAQLKLAKGSKCNIVKLVKDITSPKCAFRYSPKISCDPQNAMEWGLVHEDSARNAYYRVKNKKHYKLCPLSKGVLICKNKPMIVASVDNIRTCKCRIGCQDIVVEYKCPWKHRDEPAREAFLTPEIGGTVIKKTFSLKETSSYYSQVQVQMFVCGLSLCDFVVWTKKGIFVVPVPFDEEFVTSLCKEIESFWYRHVLPVMIHNLLDKDSASFEASCKYFPPYWYTGYKILGFYSCMLMCKKAMYNINV